MRNPDQFPRTVVRYTLALTAAVTLGALPLNTVVARGVLLGGIAGAIGFWLNTLVFRRIATQDPATLTSTAVKWSFVRLMFYALAIYTAYTLDREQYHGLFAAVVGILLVQVVMVTIAFTRLGGPQDKDPTDERE